MSETVIHLPASLTPTYSQPPESLEIPKIHHRAERRKLRQIRHAIQILRFSIVLTSLIALTPDYHYHHRPTTENPLDNPPAILTASTNTPELETAGPPPDDKPQLANEKTVQNPSPDSLIRLEAKLHPKLQIHKIPPLLEVTNKIFPGQKITLAEVLALIYTEGAFANMTPSNSYDTGSLQTLPPTAKEMFSRVANQSPEVQKEFLKILSISYQPSAFPTPTLESKFRRDVTTATSAGILYMGDSLRVINLELADKNLTNLPEETIWALRALRHNKGNIPLALLRDYLADLTTEHDPAKIKWVDLEKVLYKWIINQKSFGEFKTTTKTAQLIKLYVRRAMIYQDIFNTIEFRSVPPDFPNKLRSLIDPWITQDLAANQDSRLTVDRAAVLLAIFPTNR